MTAPKDPQLFAVRVNGNISFAIAARTEREAQNHLLGNSITIEKVRPTEAHMLGMNGVPVQYAKPEYGPSEDLFPVPPPPPPAPFPADEVAAVAGAAAPAGGSPAQLE